MKRLLVCASALALWSCHNRDAALHSPGEQEARVIEARYTQSARLDPHTEVQVTQWNAQLRHAERLRAKGQNEALREAVDARVRRWDEAAKTRDSYLVLLEVRDADAQQQDPRLDLAKWNFARVLANGQRQKAQHIELLTQDRFAAAFGGAHWRIGARVDFPLPPRPSSVTLEVQAPEESVPKGALRANLPHLPARFAFAAPPRVAPAKPATSLTPIQTSR